MFGDLKENLERINIPSKVKEYMTEARNIDNLTLEELKQLLAKVTKLEKSVIKNQGKIKDEEMMDYAKLVTDLRWALDQLCEDKEIMNTIPKVELADEDAFENLSLEDQNIILSTEVITADIKKEIESIKKVCIRYSRLNRRKQKQKSISNRITTKFKEIKAKKANKSSLSDKVDSIMNKYKSRKKKTIIPKNNKNKKKLSKELKVEIEVLLYKLSNNIKILAGDIKNKLNNRFDKIKKSKTQSNRNKKNTKKSIILKTTLLSIMLTLGIFGYSQIKNNDNDSSQSLGKGKIEHELDDDKLSDIGEIDSEMLQATTGQQVQIETTQKESDSIKDETLNSEEVVTDIKTELPVDETIETPAEIVEESETILSIGKEINLVSDSKCYSNMYDTYLNDNQLKPHYSAESMSRTISSIIVSNGEELINVKTNEELDYYLENNYEIVGCSVTNQYSTDGSIEGFYRVESIENNNEKVMNKTLI